VVSGRGDSQFHRRLVLAGESLSRARGIQRGEMENAEGANTVAGNLRQRVDAWSQSERLYLASMFLFRFMHCPLLIPWSEIQVRRNKGWLFEYVIFTMGHELGNPFADSCDVGGEAQGVGWKLLTNEET
jgi:hypothetical protein